ncbi:serpentine type 7TM GPCR chemoreceptor srbc domain-containing protein [Ditylenchus destructor]|nr:serpentine type 7TM GPCR chemoreceptor srbc domain-containing protein [Ditylenchus destructor]
MQRPGVDQSRLSNQSMPNYLSAYYYLGVDVFVMFLQAISITGNGFIIYLFYSRNRLKRNLSLRLLLTLAITDWIFGVSTIPYMVHYVALWNPEEFNYNGIIVITLSLPLTIHFKVNLLITAAIAIDRLQAMRFPMYYRKKSQMRYVYGTVFSGLVLGFVDVFFQYFLSPLPVNRGCAAVGCFTSYKFRIYWGFSNMIANVAMLALACVVAYDSVASEVSNINQANRLSMGILVISILFLMIPSTFVGVVDLFGLKTFERIGPFYIVGLLLAGASNSFIYIIFHVELRRAAKNMFQRYFRVGDTHVTSEHSAVFSAVPRLGISKVNHLFQTTITAAATVHDR